MKVLALVAIGSLMVAGCTEQAMVKQFGGTMNLNIPACVKLVNITWKEGNIWYLTRPIKPGESTDTYVFKESSAFGNVEGTITIQEHRDQSCP